MFDWHLFTSEDLLDVDNELEKLGFFPSIYAYSHFVTSGFSILKNMLLAVLSDELCVNAEVAVHVGDDPTNDKQGALAAGLESWYALLIHYLRLVLLDIF